MKKLLKEKPDNKKKKYDITCHHGTCDFCNDRNALIVHYNYSEQLTKHVRDFRLCPLCVGRGLVLLAHPLQEINKEE